MGFMNHGSVDSPVVVECRALSSGLTRRWGGVVSIDSPADSPVIDECQNLFPLVRWFVGEVVLVLRSVFGGV